MHVDPKAANRQGDGEEAGLLQQHRVNGCCAEVQPEIAKRGGGGRVVEGLGQSQFFQNEYFNGA